MASGLVDAPWGARSPSYLTSLSLKLAGAPGLRRLMKRRVRAHFARQPTPVDIAVEGIKIRCHLGDNSGEFALAEGRPENSEKIALITEALRPGSIFVDVGANFGLFTLFAARAVGPAGTVLAVEPSPLMADRARFNAATNGFDQVTVVEAALGDHEDVITLHVQERQRGRSSVIAAAGGTPTPVRMTTLATITKDLPHIDALKIDVEGYEDRVLLPFFDTAPVHMWPKRVLIEHSHSRDWERDVIATMQGAGYAAIWRGPHDLLLGLA